MGPVAGPCERTTARGCRGGAGSFGEARVPSVSGPNDYVALRGTPDDRIGWIKGRLVFLYYPNGRRALVPVRTALRSPRRRGLKQALRAPAGGVVAEVQRPSCARLWTVWGESWSARGPGVP